MASWQNQPKIYITVRQSKVAVYAVIGLASARRVPISGTPMHGVWRAGIPSIPHAARPDTVKTKKYPLPLLRARRNPPRRDPL
jgi:hypothetical protein